MEQSAWQRGYTDVAGWTKRKPVVVEALLVVAGCGFGLTLGSTWWGRGLFAVLVALGAFLLGLIGLWLWHSAAAPVRQRDEARTYARALEAHVHEYAEWARRREIADDFRRETLELACSVSEGNWHRSASDLDTHWRGNAAAAQAQLREHGAGDDVTGEIDRQLEALEAREDGYGDDEIRRIVNNMQTACQNVWSLTRSQDMPPTAPTPPVS
jgi:hypothetical protein